MRNSSLALIAFTFVASACSLTQPDGHLPAHGGPADRASQAQVAFHESINGILPCYTVIGRVVDNNSFAPLADISVLIGDSANVNQTRSAIDGNFRFDSLTGTADWIEVRAPHGRNMRVSLIHTKPGVNGVHARMLGAELSNRMFVLSSIANPRNSAQAGGTVFTNSSARYCGQEAN